jgi:uncharacterized protein YcbX
MRVRELWRFPVKSMGGERITATSITERGVHGDRLWAVRDEGKAAITNAKRIPSLMLLTARFVEEPAPGTIADVVITFPNKTTITSTDADVHARLSDFLGRPVTLHALKPASDEAHYQSNVSTVAETRQQLALEDGEPMPDFSMLPRDKLIELDKFQTPPGTYFDAYPLHVVTTASLRDWDPRRFRANVVVDTGDMRGYLENEWTGGTLALGDCAAFVECPAPRCSMPTRAQVDGVPADRSVLATIAREANRCLGVYASVTRAGALKVGDAVTFSRA